MVCTVMFVTGKVKEVAQDDDDGPWKEKAKKEKNDI